MSNPTAQITYSNPRLQAIFHNWPMGGGKIGNCEFLVERVIRKGYRVIRQTQKLQSGKLNAPKKTTYAGRAAICDGSDGRTYILQQANSFNAIHVWRSDLMTQEWVHVSVDTAVRYQEMLALIEQANINREG